MSGTSADGIDAALVEIDGEARDVRVERLADCCLPHPPALRQAILDLSDPATGRVRELCALDAALGERFAEAAIAAAASAGVALDSVDAIASHGQTVWHQPDPLCLGGVQATGTLQIGNPAVISARTGRPVVSGFRSADMAVGGQGAPLVPYFDWAVLTSDAESRAVQNIGGIGNVTHLPRGASLEDVIAFDTGPGNMLMDGLMRLLTGGALEMDAGGAWAALGRVIPALEDWILSRPFFAREPPKSTGRELFSRAFVEEVAQRGRSLGGSQQDIVATATHATAASISLAIRRWLAPRGGVDAVIVGGGGTRNATLMRWLAQMVAPARLTTHAEFGIPDDAKEAMAFALLGYETLHRRPSNVPGATGASRPVVLGSVTRV